MATQSKINRIKRELKQAYVTRYGLMKMETRVLPNIIADDEHIEAVIYGLYGEANMGIHSNSGMLVATDQRMVFIDRKPLFTNTDEFGYNSVLGININNSPLFSAVELHSANKEYHFKNVNKKCAKHFKQVIENKLLRGFSSDRYQQMTAIVGKVRQAPLVKLTDDAQEFLYNHKIGVLSTLNKDRDIDAAAIYYVVDQENIIYFITKSSTAKAHNLMKSSPVAFTVFDEETMSTMQIQGTCNVIADPDIKKLVFEEITHPIKKNNVLLSVPVTKMQHGSYVTFSLTIKDYKYRDYQKSSK